MVSIKIIRDIEAILLTNLLVDTNGLQHVFLDLVNGGANSYNTVNSIYLGRIIGPRVLYNHV